MSKRIWKIVGWIAIVALVLGVGAIAGGGIVYAMRRVDGPMICLPRDAALSDESEAGIVIASVAEDGPAAQAGVARGDILLQIDDETVDDFIELAGALEGYEPGDEVQLRVLHGDDERTLTATLGDRDGKAYLGITPCTGLPGPGRMVTIRREEPGALIVNVEPDSPADSAGLQAGDVIVAVDDQELDTETNLADVIASYEPGDTVTLEVRKPGEESRDVTVELGEHPEEEGVAYLGVTYRPLPPFHRLEIEAQPFDQRPGRLFFHALPGIEAKQGAIVQSVEEDSPAAAAGLRGGDLITAIEGEPIQGPQDLVDAIGEHKPGDTVTLTVLQSGEEEERQVEVTLAEHPEEEGKTYLGVQIGGFVHVSKIERGEQSDGREPLQFFYDFDWEAPFDDLPFDPDAMPHRFEFHFPPGHFQVDEANCCGESI